MVGSACALASPTAGPSLWSSVLERLSTRLPAESASALQAEARVLGLRPGALRIGASATTLQGWAKAGLLSEVDQALRSLTDGARSLAAVPTDGDGACVSLDPTLTLERFIAGPSNQAARAAMDALLAPGSARTPLVLVVGPPGSGRTHLLHAYGHEFARRFPPADGASEILYRSSNDLLSDLINAISTSSLPAFRNRLRGCRALLLDDAEQIAGREATQAELLGTLGELSAAGIPVVVSTSSPPEQMEGLSNALRERLASALRVELSPPEWETRVAILLDRARRWGVDLSTEVASFLAGTAGSDAASIDAVLTRLLAHPRGNAALRDVDVAQQILDHGMTRQLRAPAPMVIALVARHFNLRVRDLRSSSRSRRITVPRQVAMYLLRQHSQLSFPEIGRRFDRHHTTAMHSFYRVQEEVQQDGNLRAAVRLLEKELLRLAEHGG
jgi:chromosomal replication initiator protein